MLFVKHCSEDMFFRTGCPTLSQDSEKNSNTKLVTRKRSGYVPLKTFMDDSKSLFSLKKERLSSTNILQLQWMSTKGREPRLSMEQNST